MSDDNFYDFDSFLNFGNKHGAKTDSAGIEDKPKPQIDDNFSPNTKSVPQSVSFNARRQSSYTVRKKNPEPVALRSRQKQMRPIRNRVSEIELPEISTDTTLKSVDWTEGSPFSKFDSFLDDRNSINSDWYPWTNRNYKDTGSQPMKGAAGQSSDRPNSKGGKSRKATSKTPKPKSKSSSQKKLNLNSLDKAAVREICQSTRMRHVKNLCREYSLALPTKTTVAPAKKKWPTKKRKRTKKPKPVSQRKTETLKQHKPDEAKVNGPLFFKPNSFQRRRTQHSFFDSLTSLIWPPADLFRPPITLTPAKKTVSGRRSDQTISSRKGWLGRVFKSYGFV